VPGVRVSVPFGRRQVVGVVVGSTDSTDVPQNKLRTVLKVLDEEPVLPSSMLELLEWASRYYHHPIGEVLASALPVLLRRAAIAEVPKIECFQLLREPLTPVNARASVQLQLLERLRLAEGAPVDAQSLSGVSRQWRKSLRALIDDGAVEPVMLDALPKNHPTLSIKRSDRQR